MAEREWGEVREDPSEEVARSGKRMFQLEGTAYAIQRGLEHTALSGKDISGSGTAGAKGWGWECVQQALETVQGWRFPARTVGAEIVPKWGYRARLCGALGEPGFGAANSGEPQNVLEFKRAVGRRTSPCGYCADH